MMPPPLPRPRQVSLQPEHPAEDMPIALSLEPTISPAALMSLATVKRPPRVPRSVITPLSQRKAWSYAGPEVDVSHLVRWFSGMGESRCPRRRRRNRYVTPSWSLDWTQGATPRRLGINMGLTREVRVRPGFGHLYPEARAGWESAAALASRVADRILARHGYTAVLKNRLLADAHFEFRGGSSAPRLGRRSGRLGDGKR